MLYLTPPARPQTPSEVHMVQSTKNLFPGPVDDEDNSAENNQDHLFDRYTSFLSVYPQPCFIFSFKHIYSPLSSHQLDIQCDSS